MCNLTFKDGKMLSFCMKIDSLSAMLNEFSSIAFGFHPQPQTGSGTTLRPYREKEEVTTCAKKRAHSMYLALRCSTSLHD